MVDTNISNSQKKDLKMSRIYITENLTGKTPEWYWDKTGGFHDAKIISSKEITLDYNYAEPNTVRNYYEVELHLVKNQYIRFYNSKVLQGSFEVGNWWLCDTLREENNKFILDITVCDSKGKEKKVSVKFDYSEVI